MYALFVLVAYGILAAAIKLMLDGWSADHKVKYLAVAAIFVGIGIAFTMGVINHYMHKLRK